MDFLKVLEAVLPIYLIAGVGVFLRARQVVTAEMEKGLLKLVIHCLYPCLILDKTLGNDLVRQGDIVGWGIGLGLGLVMVGMIASWIVATILGMKPGQGKRTFTLSGGVQNYGYTAIPILMALFVVGGNDDVLGVLFIHSLGVEIAIWFVGMMVLTGSVIKSPKQLINGPIVAVVLGVGLSWTGGWKLFDPEMGGIIGLIIRQAMSWLGACAFPIGLLLIGATMYDMVGKESLSPKVGLGASLVRLLIMPLVILSAAKFLPIAPALQQVLLVQAAMPAAVTPIIVARHYGGSPGVAVQVVLVTSALALITMPLWISWGVKFVF
ncbi:AEC family transporter [Akkermansiaceae bacterium]|nr:AEC family transporter [Akkermansiaceae bacterium]MDB4287956.1 AEC family transporter [bacterium]MDA7535900.1 AEC family transporter [Akkermansiaceae bacterium]MDA7537903.1 AEC family transporter [Akkermansiaceae bacterium]MDA7651142.1 AEC family transporter [Akkermansiaceae bacterium]